MSKAKINEVHTYSIEGTLDIREDGKIFIEIEGLGSRNLADLLTMAGFNGTYMKNTTRLANEITE